jgi:hypothetical protein
MYIFMLRSLTNEQVFYMMIKNAGYFSEADIVNMGPIVSAKKKEEYNIVLT